MDKPPIVETISQYIPLKPAGKEYKANCPFHEDKTPSFFVNAEREVFYCFGCGEAGDIFEFLMKWSGKSFKEVCDHLGIKGTERRIMPDETHIAAEKIRVWIVDFSNDVAKRMRIIGSQSRGAWLCLKENVGDKSLMLELLEQLNREWSILETLHEDLVNPDYILELYEHREDLESLVSNG